MMDLPDTRRSIDQYSRFLEPTIPKGQENYYNPRKPLIGKELSIGNIERTDMVGNLDMYDAILEFLEEGQIGAARFLLTRFQGELKLTMSFEGLFMEYIGTSKFEYKQTQDITEHLPQQRKRGLLGGLK